jgi:AraC-like DNA-binding protein
MKLRTIEPKEELKPYIHSIWIFESAEGTPRQSSRVIVPNGRAKIIIPYMNALTASKDLYSARKEGEALLIGPWDEPVVISSEARKTGTIGIEFTPHGAYRFARINFGELLNRIYYLREVYGPAAKKIEERMLDVEDPAAKAGLFQEFLISQMGNVNAGESIIDYAVGRIVSTCGMLEIKELERLTGYSKRYLSLLFHQHIGLSPKTLAAIARFQMFYKLWAAMGTPDFYKNDLNNYYYDQPHFIKEFKRFTGYSPKLYAETNNDFGKIFYRK